MPSGVLIRIFMATALILTALAVLDVQPRTAHVEDVGSHVPTAQHAPPADAARVPVVEPENYRLDDYRKPVPSTLKGATVLSATAASALWAATTAVLRDA